MTPPERPVTFTSDGLTIEGMLHEGPGDLGAVVLHPHPQYGGDMDNDVVLALCGALADGGATTLRFDFRGTGRSEGAFDGGRGETHDARAAIEVLREGGAVGRLVVAGYSFGAMVAATVAEETNPHALVLVSPPVGVARLSPLPAGHATLLVTGERDGVAPPEAVRSYGGPGASVEVVPGADHGWWPGVDLLRASVSRFLLSLPADS